MFGTDLNLNTILHCFLNGRRLRGFKTDIFSRIPGNVQCRLTGPFASTNNDKTPPYCLPNSRKKQLLVFIPLGPPNLNQFYKLRPLPSPGPSESAVSRTNWDQNSASPSALSVRLVFSLRTKCRLLNLCWSILFLRIPCFTRSSNITSLLLPKIPSRVRHGMHIPFIFTKFVMNIFRVQDLSFHSGSYEDFHLLGVQRRILWWKSTDVSEKYVASFFVAEQ